jgi:hypothetical protein
MNFKVTNKKTFPVDPVTGRRLVTTGDLDEISEFAIEVEGAEPPAWESYDVEHEDFATAGTTSTIELLELPAGGVIHAVVIERVTAFAGGAISAYTLQVGITGTLNKYAGAYSVAAAASATGFQISSVVGMENLEVGTSIKITATSTDANTNAAEGGAARIHVLMSRLWKEE